VRNSKRITGLLTPVDNSEPATKEYVDTHTGGNYLPLSGGTLTGVLTVNNEIHIEQDRRLRFGPNNDNRIILDDKNELGIYTPNGQIVFRPNDLLTNTTLNMGTNDILNVKTLSTKSIFVPEENDNENAIFFAGTHNDRPGNDGNYHTGIVERIFDSAENSELLLYKGNDTTDRIRMVASSIRFQAGAMLKDTMATEYENVMVVSGDQVDILKKLHMNEFKIENVAAPTADNDAATKKYVDDNIGGETIRHIDETFTNFNPTGVSQNFSASFADIPDGEYYFDINVTLKYTNNNSNAEGFKFLVNPAYVVSPSGFDYGTTLEMRDITISTGNNTFGSVNMKWYDTRASTNNNDSVFINLNYNGGGALNFDVNMRGTIKKI
jgi:hypothetical protein